MPDITPQKEQQAGRSEADSLRNMSTATTTGESGTSLESVSSVPLDSSNVDTVNIPTRHDRCPVNSALGGTT